MPFRTRPVVPQRPGSLCAPCFRSLQSVRTVPPVVWLRQTKSALPPSPTGMPDLPSLRPAEVRNGRPTANNLYDNQSTHNTLDDTLSSRRHSVPWPVVGTDTSSRHHRHKPFQAPDNGRLERSDNHPNIVRLPDEAF